jgi:hypothetical protein
MAGVVSDDKLIAELKANIKLAIGSFASPEMIVVSSDLPKTKSGKIMRRLLRKVAEGETEGLGDLSTLVDPGSVTRLVDQVAVLLSENVRLFYHPISVLLSAFRSLSSSALYIPPLSIFLLSAFHRCAHQLHHAGPSRLRYQDPPVNASFLLLQHYDAKGYFCPFPPLILSY